jgi:hypothetical protein
VSRHKIASAFVPCHPYATNVIKVNHSLREVNGQPDQKTKSLLKLITFFFIDKNSTAPKGVIYLVIY